MMERSSHYTILRKVSSANGSTSPEGSDPATRPASPCTSGRWSTPDSPGAPVPVAGRYIFSPMGGQSANHVLLSSMTAATLRAWYRSPITICLEKRRLHLRPSKWSTAMRGHSSKRSRRDLHGEAEPLRISYLSRSQSFPYGMMVQSKEQPKKIYDCHRGRRPLIITGITK